MKGVRRDSADGSRAALLARIVKLLRRGESIALSGLPATGKTYLAEKALARIEKDKRFVICRFPVTESMVEAGKKANFSEVFFDAALKALGAATGRALGSRRKVPSFRKFIDALAELREHDGRRIVLLLDDWDRICDPMYEISDLCCKLSYVLERKDCPIAIFFVSVLTPRLVEGAQEYCGSRISSLLRNKSFVLGPLNEKDYWRFFREQAKGKRISTGAALLIERYSMRHPAIASLIIGAYEGQSDGSDVDRFVKAVELPIVRANRLFYLETLRQWIGLAHYASEGLWSGCEKWGVEDLFREYGFELSSQNLQATFLGSLIGEAR